MKLTKTGYQLGSSEMGAIVMQKDDFQTRDEIYESHFNARNKVESIKDAMLKNNWAIKRGNAYELPTFLLFYEELLQAISNELGDIPELEQFSWEQPTKCFAPEDYNPNHRLLGMGSSIDFIIKSQIDIEVEVRKQKVKIVKGKNIIEIKTDFYKGGKLKPSWAIQVQHQFVCSGISNGAVVCFAQDGDLHIYPMEINEKMCKLIMAKAKEFWELIEKAERYPKIVEPQDKSLRTKVLDDTIIKKTNHDLVQLAEDYLVASVEQRKWGKTKDDIKSSLTDVLDNLELDVLTIPEQYQIKSVFSEVPKKKMVETGEMTERHSFTIKEIKDE